MSDNGEVQVHELERLEAAYRILTQRDGTAERRAWQWECLAFTMVGICVLLLCALFWLMVKRTQVQAFVHVVQVNEDGRVINLGVPQDLLTYRPQEAQWLEMLSEWVRRMRWRGSDAVVAQANWTWARAHLCGRVLSALVDELERREKPFTDLGKRLVAVEITAATATEDGAYHVFWTETTTEHAVQGAKKFVGTFTVGRVRPASQAVLMQNRLGLCLTAFNMSEQP